MRSWGASVARGAGVTAAMWAAVLAFPTSTAPEPGLPQLLASADARRLDADVDDAPTGIVAQVQDHLAARMPDHEPDALYELAYTVVEEAAEARLDPLLVLALIEVESNFDPGSISDRGARGLMQLREATLQREFARAGLPAGDPHDPVDNVRAGIRYLRRLVEAFGSQEVALMAYNAGPNRILGYLREGGIPERFEAYPRRVLAELRRLRRSVGVEAAPAVADAVPVAARRGALGN